MDTYKVIMSKLDIRQFDSKKVAAEVKSKVLEAARASGTGNNKQEWRFILVQEKEMLKRVGEDSTSRGWVAGGAVAGGGVSDPSFGFHVLDAGRAGPQVGLAACPRGVS